MDKKGQERGIFAQRYIEPRESSFSPPLDCHVGAEASSFPSWYSQERYIVIKKVEGKTILDSLIATGVKMTRTPSNETILFSFN